MMYLSKHDLETIADTELRDYAGRIKGGCALFRIGEFAEKHLGLRIRYETLSDSGDILGLAAYKGMSLELTAHGETRATTVDEDSVFIEERLIFDKEKGRLEFTIAHECAHFILDRLGEKREGISFRRLLARDKPYSCRDLKTLEDWREWQANALAAALLMPAGKVSAHLPKRALTVYGDRLNRWDYQSVRSLAFIFRVTVRAMTIRLIELGLIERKSCNEYAEYEESPMIWAKEETI